MVTSRPQPTDAVHEYGDDELFFSTTDAKGVIRLANSTFARLSHYAVEELFGAPHNLIRHPSMPGGAFALLWEEIEAGRPACVYVDNLAKDGGSYRVLATVVPIDDGYLSVRMRPRHQPLVDASLALYAQAAGIERTAREGGMSARDAAQLGKASILEGLAAAGLPSTAELAAAVLPAELAENHRRTSGLPQRPGATGPAAEVLAEMHALDAEQAAVLPALDDLAALGAEFADAWPRVAPALDRLDAAATTAGAPVDGVSAEVADDLAYHGEQIAERVRSARAALDGTEERLARMQQAISAARLRIALVRLHTLMVATFAAEVVDGRGVGDTKAALAALARALDGGAGALAEDVERLERDLGDLGERLRTAVSETDRLRRPLFRWQAAVGEAGRQDLADLVPTEVDGLAELSGLAARVRLLTVGFDADAVRRRVASVRQLAEAA